MKTLLFLFVIGHLTVVVCFAQSAGATVKADANACELNSLHLDGLRDELANSPTAKIIAKFYAGKSETVSVGEKRVSYIRKFLEQRKRFDFSRVDFVNSVMLATKENPKTEFYLVQAGETEGSLYLVTYSQPNKTPCLDCCGKDLMPPNIGSNSKPKPNKTNKTKIKPR
jgi:hypothetical protein